MTCRVRRVAHFGGLLATEGPSCVRVFVWWVAGRLSFRWVVAGWAAEVCAVQSGAVRCGAVRTNEPWNPTATAVASSRAVE